MDSNVFRSEGLKVVERCKLYNGNFSSNVNCCDRSEIHLSYTSLFCFLIIIFLRSTSNIHIYVLTTFNFQAKQICKYLEIFQVNPKQLLMFLNQLTSSIPLCLKNTIMKNEMVPKFSIIRRARIKSN